MEDEQLWDTLARAAHDADRYPGGYIGVARAVVAAYETQLAIRAQARRDAVTTSPTPSNETVTVTATTGSIGEFARDPRDPRDLTGAVTCDRCAASLERRYVQTHSAWHDAQDNEVRLVRQSQLRLHSCSRCHALTTDVLVNDETGGPHAEHNLWHRVQDDLVTSLVQVVTSLRRQLEQLERRDEFKAVRDGRTPR